MQSRYAVLGRWDPTSLRDARLRRRIQEFEDTVSTSSTFRCVGQLSQLNNLVDGTLNDLTDDVWEDIQTVFARSAASHRGRDDLPDRPDNLWSLYLPLRQVDDLRTIYWPTSCTTSRRAASRRSCRQRGGANAVDGLRDGQMPVRVLAQLPDAAVTTRSATVVNRIVESPYRNLWQRHRMVENFIDAHVGRAGTTRAPTLARPTRTTRHGPRRGCRSAPGGAPG